MEETKILVWSKQMRCLELKECSAIVDLEMWLWVISTMHFFIRALKVLSV
jgi:hypothetical protein